MEKLIELLNEYEVEKKPSRLQRSYYLWFVHNFWKWIMYIDEEWEDVDDYKTDYEIINKEYWFIKWLVDNDKIDIEKIENSEYYLIDWFYYNERKKFWIEWKEDVEKILLMLLSISDTPIDDLISYLK